MGQSRARKGVEEDISKKKVKGVLRKLKDGKAAGIDEVPGKGWRYGGEDLERWIWEFYNRV